MTDQLYERLAPEWRKCLETGEYMEETDQRYYAKLFLEGDKTRLAKIFGWEAPHE